MNWRTPLILTYAVIVLIGGFIGYLKAGSLPSLIMGTLSFGWLVFCLGLTRKKPFLGHLLAVLSIDCLFLFFAWRYLLLLRFFPAGVMGLLSLIVGSILTGALVKKKIEKKKKG